MAPIKIERIVTVSSEDEKYPAENLLKLHSINKKWKCKEPGETQVSVVFQLAEFCRITTVDVGNEHSAFIELLVGKSCNPNDDLKVLLVTSSLMTLQEAKYGTNPNGVTFFKEDSLCSEVCKEKWDRVKVVCTQPFNKHTQYGLSFIVFHTDSEPINQPNNTSLGNFQLKAVREDEPLLKVGGLFARRTTFLNEPASSGAAAVRAAGANVELSLRTTIKNEDNPMNVTSSLKDRLLNSEEKKRKRKLDIHSNEKTEKKKIHLKGNTPSRNVGQSTSRKKEVATVQPFKKKEERPFNNLMSGVVFSISGYENPLRSELRNKAIAMGARYEANWNSNCTHLLCAFRNTPKFHQVRGHGIIIKKDWFEECYRRRMRLPWRRFALDRNDASQVESEEEIYEKVDTPVSAPVKRKISTETDEEDKAFDTDEEIEQVRQKQKALRVDDPAVPSTSGLKNIDNSTSVNKIQINHEDNIDTESEDENFWFKTKLEENSLSNSLPPLPPFLLGATIALLDDLSVDDRKLLSRYIKAHGGEVADEGTNLNAVLYVISEDVTSVNRVKEDFPQLIGITPEWIWRSHDEAKLLPASQYELK